MPIESESATRRIRIDAQLKSEGWHVVPYSEATDLARLTNHAIEEFPTASGPAYYALVVNGQILGIVEAKRLEVGAVQLGVPMNL